MKKLYALITVLAAVISMSAQTDTQVIPFTFCVNIEDPSVCYLQDGNYNKVDVVAGENVLQANYYKTTNTDGSCYGYLDSYYLYINSDKQSDYMITGCDVVIDGNRSAYSAYYGPTSSLNLTAGLFLEMQGCVLYPVISNLDDLRTATATVTVADASKVMIQCGYSGYTPTLVDGANTIKFDPENESRWRIGARNYGEYLGGVTLNGVAQQESYGSYELTVANGDVIDISTEDNSAPCNVLIKFTNEGTEEALSAVSSYVNYQSSPIENWTDGFQVDKRSQIILSLNQADYNISSVTVNGSQQSLYSSDLYITITEDSEIVITAKPYATYDITLSVSDPSQVEIRLAESMYSASYPLADIVAGTQTVKVSEKMTYMLVNPLTGIFVDNISYTDPDGKTQTVESGYSGYAIPLAAGTSVDITTHAKKREAMATLYVNDTNNMYSLYLQYSDGAYVFSTYGDVAPVTGDQTFYFDPDTDNPFTLYFAPTDYETPGYVTVNGNLVEPRYTGSTSYELVLTPGDVVGVYANAVFDTSALSSISGDSSDNVVYDLTGRAVNRDGRLAPGIYINGGRKFIVR